MIFITCIWYFNLTFVLLGKLSYHFIPLNWTIWESWIQKHVIMVWIMVNHGTSTEFDRNLKKDVLLPQPFSPFWVFTQTLGPLLIIICLDRLLKARRLWAYLYVWSWLPAFLIASSSLAWVAWSVWYPQSIIFLP